MMRWTGIVMTVLFTVIATAALAQTDAIPPSPNLKAFADPTKGVIAPASLPAAPMNPPADDPRMVMLSVRLFEQHATSENRPQGLLTKV